MHHVTTTIQNVAEKREKKCNIFEKNLNTPSKQDLLADYVKEFTFFKQSGVGYVYCNTVQVRVFGDL